MNSLDFFSISPNLYIFQKEENKTNFGGFLFIIYLIIMFFISLLYILEFFTNDKYDYKCSTVFNFDEDSELNPTVQFRVINPFYDEFIFYECEYETGEYIEGNYTYELKTEISEFCMEIYYICNDSNCSSLKSWIPYDSSLPYLGIFYKDFKVEHQANTPLQISDEIYDTHQRFYFTPFNYYDVSFTWENIIYKEEKDISNILLKQKDHYNFGYLDEPRITNEFSIIDDYEDRVIYDDEIGKYTINIARMILESNTFSYLECSRKKNTFLDVIAKIGALFSTLNFFLSTFFSFYSKNFNNYKIIDKILNIKKERDKYIELSINLDNSIPLMKEEENKIKNQKNIDDINKSEFNKRKI